RSKGITWSWVVFAVRVESNPSPCLQVVLLLAQSRPLKGIGLSGIAKWKSYRGIGLWEMVRGELGDVLGGWFGLETMGEGGMVLAPLKGIGLSGIAKWKSYRGIGLWEMVRGELGDVLGGCNGLGFVYWAQLGLCIGPPIRLGPSKSSHVCVTIARQWAVAKLLRATMWSVTVFIIILLALPATIRWLRIAIQFSFILQFPGSRFLTVDSSGVGL
ncbi:hypothetical protein Tco_0572356, partial [Tanacetum coccineum]